MLSIEIVFVFGLLIVAIILFVSEVVSFDVTALIIMSSLLATGILTPNEALAGFSNTATITIAAMFVLSEGVRQTGALEQVGGFFSRLGERSYWQAILAMMMIIGLISAFINNTAAVAIFIPVILTMATNMHVSPSKLLMPLSFASMFGGVCTLIGTSTNLLVSSIAVQHGEVAFSMFEFTPLGLIFMVVGLAYMFFIGNNLIPERRTDQEITANFNMSEYLTDVVLEPGFKYYGRSSDEVALTRDLDIDVVQVVREGGGISAEGSKTELKPGDILRVRGSADDIRKLRTREDVTLKRIKDLRDQDLLHGDDVLVEVIIPPDSELISQKVQIVDFPNRLGAVLLAIRHRGALQQAAMDEVQLSGGDEVMLMMSKERLPELERRGSFILANKISPQTYQRDKLPLVLLIMLGVVLTASFDFVPIVIGSLVGCVLMLLSRCLTSEQAYEAINWKIIILLAGVLPLGTAMEKTGSATLISNFLLTLGQDWGATAILSGFFLVAMLLTNIISNQATAVLLAPIAFEAANSLGVSPRPFLIAVTFAASLSFMTPVGYQTNTLIYGPGHYKFTDFTKVGTPLNIIFWILATFLIPLFWPF